MFVQVGADLQEARALGIGPDGFRMPAVRHEERQKFRETGIDLHVADRRFRAGQREEVFAEGGIGRGQLCGEGGQTSALQVLFIDAGGGGTIEMDPVQVPEIVRGLMVVGACAVDEYAASLGERISAPFIIKNAGAGADGEE